MAIQIRLRRDNTQNWYEINPILADGEMGIEHLDNGKNKIKIGNGVNTYSELEYFADVISYLDIINKPTLNGVEISGNKSLFDYGIQPSGNYASYNDVIDGLALKADKDKTYSKDDIDTFFNNLLKIPSIEDENGKYLKVINGEIVWSNLEGEIVTIETLNEKLESKVDKKTGYSLISNVELQRLSTVDNYDDEPIKDEIKLLTQNLDDKASINFVEENYISNIQLDERLESYAKSGDIAGKANASDLANHINNNLNPHHVTAEQVGLGRVDNTSDLLKPLSQAAIDALALKQNKLESGYGINIENNIITNTSPNVQADWNAEEGNAVILNKPALSNVATSGSYNDLSDKPYIPEDYQLKPATKEELGGIKVGDGLDINDEGILTVSNTVLNYDNLENKPSIGGIVLVAGQTAEDLDLATAKATQSELNLKANIADLENYTRKEDIELELDKKADKASSLAGYGILDAATKTEVNAKQDKLTAGSGIEISADNVISSSAIVEEVSWGNIKGTLNNQLDLKSALEEKQPKGDYALYADIPTKTSELENDSGFLTSHQDISNLVTKEELNTSLESKADKNEITEAIEKSEDAIQKATTAQNSATEALTKANEVSGNITNLTTRVETNETQITSLGNLKQDKLTAGSGIEISADNVISATGGSSSNSGIIICPNVSVTSALWESDTTYTDYPFKAKISIEKAKSTNVPQVIFNVIEATMNSFAPITECEDGFVSIWCKEKLTNDITIPTILLFSGEEYTTLR